MKMNQFLQWPESVILLYLIIFFLFLYLLISWFNKPETCKFKLPPSPSKLPIIGNLHQLHGAPHRAFQSLAEKHGPIMLLHLGGKPTLVVSSVDIARDVIKTYDHVFSYRPELEFAKILFYGKDMVFAPYGEYWRQVRKICVFELLSVKKVKSFRYVREQEIVHMVDMIKKSPSSTSVNLSELFHSLTYSIICRIALGRKYNEGKSGTEIKAMLKEISYLIAVPNIGDLIPSLAWVNRLNGLKKRVETCFQDFDSFIHEVVEEHIKKQRIDGDGSGENEEKDFVDVMLEIEKDSSFGIPFVRDNTKAIILDMFSAGTDTSSVAMEWAMSEIIRHPNIMAEVQKEVRNIARGKIILDENDTEEMHYLKAVIKETLRLHPPLPFLIPHESVEKVQIQGYDIPAKTTVMINVFAIGRDPLWWEEPEKFLPKRFLNGDSASIDFKGQDFQFIPFGAGRRGCPGIHFSVTILELTLANLLNIFDWELPKDMNGNGLDMLEASGVAVSRKNDLLLTAKPHYY